LNLLPASQAKEKVFKIGLHLTPAQKEIDRNFKRFTIVRAGRKFGKTTYARKKVLEWLGPANSCVWLISPTYRQGKLIAWSDIKRTIPAEALARKPNDSELHIQLKNGSELYLMGSDDPDSLRGPKPTAVIFEEAAYHKADAWENIIRPNLMVHKAPALFISSPNGFNWFKDLEDRALEDIELNGAASEWAVFHYNVYSNPHIDRAEIDKIATSVDPRVWSQEYMANYESSVGRVFHEFQDTPRHMREFPRPQSGEKCYRSIDWGLRDDTGVLWSNVRDRRLHIYREYAEHDLAPQNQALIVRNMTPAGENIYRNIIGHDAARSDVEMKGLTIKWHFTEAGIIPLSVGGRKKENNRAMIQQLLAEDRLVIHPECRKLRRQLLSYSWKDTAMEKTEDGGDDLVDSLHSMVELLQYELFTKSNEERQRPMSEIMEAIEKERSQPVRFKLHSEREESGMSMSGAGGYLE
jgi:hypothetical protein